MAFDLASAKPAQEEEVKTRKFDVNSAKPIDTNKISVFNPANDLIVNTDLTDGKKVDYMSNVQIAGKKREDYFGMQEIENDIDDQYIQDFIGKESGPFLDLARGVANETISFAQSINRQATKIGARSIMAAQIGLRKVKGEDVTGEMTEWNRLISQELVSMAKTNEKYRQGLGIEKTRYDGIVYDLGGLLSQLGRSFVFKSAALVAASFAASQQQQLSEEIFQTTGKTGRAEIVSTAIALPTAAVEAIGLNVFTKALKGSGIVTKIIKSSITEAVQEGLQGTIEEVGTQAFGGRVKETEDTIKDIAYGMLLGFIGGATVSTVAGTASELMQKKGVDKNTADSISESLSKKFSENTDLHEETANILSRQNDNTTNYGNNVENGIAEVNRVLDERFNIKREDVKKTPLETLIEEARGDNFYLGEQELIDVLETYEQAEQELRKTAPKSLVQFIKENGGIFDERGDLASRDMQKAAPFVLRKSSTNAQGLDVTPDAVAFRAWEAGYFPEFETRPTIQDLLNAIDDDLRGAKRVVGVDLDTQLQRKEYENIINQIGASNIDLEKVKILRDIRDGKIPLPGIPEEEALKQIAKGEITDQQRVQFEKELKDAEVRIKTNTDENFKKQEALRNQNFLIKTGGAIKDFARWTAEAFDSVTKPTSSVIEKIDPKLWVKVSKYLYSTGIEGKKSMEKIKPFNDKFRKLDKKTFSDMDFYMKNISTKEGAIGFKYKQALDALLKKNNMTAEFEAVRNELNRIYGELKDVGVDVGFLENYIPRMVDPKQRENFLSYIKGSEKYSDIMNAIEQEKFYQEMTLDEKAKFVNNFLRGFIPKDIITISRIGNIKYERTIQEIDADLNQFYLKTSDALIKYVDSTTKTIEQKKLFGAESKEISAIRTAIKRKRNQIDKSIETGKSESHVRELQKELESLQKQVEESKDFNLEDSIGRLVYEIAESGKLDSKQEDLLKRSLRGIVDVKPTPKATSVVKNLTYAATLGNVKTTISQLGDLGLSLYKNGYISNIKAIASKKEIDVKDLGIDSIMHELSTQDGMSKFVDLELKLTGLNKLDLTMKNIDVNSNLVKTRNLLKKGDIKTNQEIDFTFDEFEGQAEQVKQDIINGNITEDVGFYLYNNLSRNHPINIASMPLSYLESPRARLFYSLKTFALKQLDFTRKEIFAKMKKEPVQAFKNSIKLQTALMLMGASKDFIKSFWDDEPFEMEPALLNNILIYNLIGRYTFEFARERGVISAAVNFITPAIVGVSEKTIAGIADEEKRGLLLNVIPFGKDYRAIEENLM